MFLYLKSVTGVQNRQKKATIGSGSANSIQNIERCNNYHEFKNFQQELYQHHSSD
jgi:hypothetical protein